MKCVGVVVVVVVIQLLSRVQLFATPWTVAHQASLFFTISQSLLKLMSEESMMPSKHLILCHPLLLLPSIFASIRVLYLYLKVNVYGNFPGGPVVKTELPMHGAQF